MPSSLGYPFPPVGGASAHAGILSTLATSTMTAAFSTAIFPWHCFLRWLSWCTGIALRSVTTLGAPPPAGFIPSSKLQELNSIVNHMHTREDLYRRAIRELQEELDAKDSDRKKALRKLRVTKDEIASLTDRLSELQAAYESTDGEGGSNHGGRGVPTNGGSFLVHTSVIATSAAVWWFSQIDHAALHWKLVFSMFFPLLWIYVSWVAGGGNRRRYPMLLLISAWFLAGFAVALTLNSS